MLLFPLLLALTPCTGDVTQILQKGGDIELSAGECTVSETIRITVPTHIQGRGLALTRIRFQDHIHGIHFDTGSDRSQIENLTLVQRGALTATPTVGLRLSVRASIDHVQVQNFVQCLRVEASVARGTNANNWDVMKLVCINSQHAGIFVDGTDVNVGWAGAVEVNSACRRASYWASRLGSCGGLVDSSFLGNGWYGAHVSMTEDRDGTAVAPAFIFVGDNQHSTILEAYREGGNTGPAVMAQWTTSISGISTGWTGAGLRLDGPNANRLTFKNDKDLANVTTLDLGNASGSGALMALSGVKFVKPLRFKLSGSSVLLDVGNLAAGAVMKIDGAGNVWFPKPLKVGASGMVVP